MKNQIAHQPSAVQSKRVDAGNHLPITGLGLGIIAAATAVVIICLTIFPLSSSSRPSTPAEIAAQIKFQEQWNSGQEDSIRLLKY